MKRRDRRTAEIRNETIRETLGVAELVTPADLRIVLLALEDRARNHAGTPAGIAADRLRDKLDRLERNER